MEKKGRFPSAFEVPPPPDVEGWEEMYPYYLLFSKERKEYEEKLTWFWDSMHYAGVLYPFDTITLECRYKFGLNAYNTRVWCIPAAYGTEQRVLYGYVYQTSHIEEDPEVIRKRTEIFRKRAGYYYEHWDEIYSKWENKVKKLIEELRDIKFEDLPDVVPDSVIIEGDGLLPSYKLIKAYDDLLDCVARAWHYHFELLNLTYSAYLAFYDFMKSRFPDVSDRTIAELVSGIDVLMFRPGEEIKRLARLALDLNVAEIIEDEKATVEDILLKLKESNNGRKWLEEFEKAKWPWFYCSGGTGHEHYPKWWFDDLDTLFSMIRRTIEGFKRGTVKERDVNKIREERERKAEEYRSLLSPEDREIFDALRKIAMKVFPYAENHVFYIENVAMGLFYSKVREVAKILVKHGFLRNVEEIWYLRPSEVREALLDLCETWANAPHAVSIGPKHWSRIVEKRKQIIEKLKKWSPPPVLGPLPEKITEPFTVMLWGVTRETIEKWLEAKERTQEMLEKEGIIEIKGIPASPGIVEGIARVIDDPEKIGEVQRGEILICPELAPSLTSIFHNIKGLVADLGGVMSHAAIVAREYGLPAVVGTGYAVKVVKTGDKVKVDGNAGIVTVYRGVKS